MFPRKRLDIGWSDLVAALVYCATARGHAPRVRRVEELFATVDRGRRGAFACLSVRSGLDVCLEALRLAAGSEVLVSALTIPDMLRVIERHGLVPVPVDVDPATLAPRHDACERAASPRTRALLVAHLFGARFDLDPWLPMARARGWFVLEDCAQAFVGREFTGHPAADVSMFSFGPIKTQTALAGGVLLVRDAGLLERMRAVQRSLPVAGNSAFARRVVKYAGLKLLSTPALFGLLAWVLARSGRDLDAFLRASTRGFTGGDLFAELRFQPSAALCALLARRLVRCDPERIACRARTGAWMRELLPQGTLVPGATASEPTYWVFPVVVDPGRVAELVATLRRAGFDATPAAALAAVPAPDGLHALEPHAAVAMLAGLVYLPVYPELPRRAAHRLAGLLQTASA
ncbi:MAG: DegT/DnrJ/EryC1/StrS family aminotransferase [Planctomycetota bacterium]